MHFLFGMVIDNIVSCNNRKGWTTLVISWAGSQKDEPFSSQRSCQYDVTKSSRILLFCIIWQPYYLFHSFSTQLFNTSNITQFVTAQPFVQQCQSDGIINILGTSILSASCRLIDWMNEWMIEWMNEYTTLAHSRITFQMKDCM